MSKWVHHTTGDARPPCPSVRKCLTIRAPAFPLSPTAHPDHPDPMEPTTLALLVLIPLLVWRIYFRLKGLLGGRRPSRPGRHWLTALLFTALLALAATRALGAPLALSCLGAGALAGAWLARWNLRLTRFENTADGLFHTPNPRLGMTVTMLFIARLLYGVLELYVNDAPPAPAGDFLTSPLSMLTCGLCAAYHAACGWGLLLWRRGQRPPPASPR